MTTDIHSCSYYCERPECVRAQRDELVKRFVERPADGDWVKVPRKPTPEMQEAAGGHWSMPGASLIGVYRAMLAAAPTSSSEENHPDDIAVDQFAEAMKVKLAEAREKGRGGWQDNSICPQHRLSDMLRAHVEKGDPRDVANFCMFLHQRGQRILPTSGENVRDAERYRWLRKNRLSPQREVFLDAESVNELDSDIDAEIAASREQEVRND